LRGSCAVRGRRCVWLALSVALALRVPASAQAPLLPLLPNGVAFDAAGNLYFADTNRHQVYESSLAGVLSVVAGNGVQGFAGDGGAATSAELNSPQGVAVGADGTLYIADTGNQRIRTVVAGQIATFAGSGVAGFAGDSGPSLAASFSAPVAVAIDATGALLVCDSANHRVRWISAGVIATVAGSGVQGFAGDGAAAVAAQLDTPSGVAVGADGRMYIADSRNDRIRVVAVDGTIGTFAGTGVRGFAGDGGAASAAELSLPRGLFVTAAGAVVFADSNNQRLRMVDANGVITTIAGSGIQGGSADGSAALMATLDSPRGVAVSAFGAPVFADARNQQVRESLSNGNLYLPAGLAVGRASRVSLSEAATATYGQASATVSVAGGAGTAQGVVDLLDGTSVVVQTTLVAGAGSFAPVSLGVGEHTLSAAFLGDGVNPAGTSGTVAVNIGAATVTATANPETMKYGQAVPVLTGSLSGVLAQDSGNVSVVFSTTAGALSAPGTYPISATLAGAASGNYVVVLSATSGSLQIGKAASLTEEQPLAQNSYTGLPLALNATVASTTQGTPTGTVIFSDGSSVVATVALVGGTASATYAAPAAGSHSIVAAYLGDTDFSASSSQAVTTTVGAMPDFTVAASGGSSQTIAAGQSASYTLTVAAQPAPFTGAVSLSASGLPAGAVVAFSPPQTVPGAGSAVVTMSVQTAAAAAQERGQWLVVALLPLPFWMGRRRRSRWRLVAMCGLVLALVSAVGCGSRSISTDASTQQIYTLQVTGTATNLAGAVVTHSATVTLIVQ
jgi:sugar lactone lactonase YvrE